MLPSITITPEPRAVPPPRDDTGARIGPNAVLRLAEALSARRLGDLIGPLFVRADAADWLTAPPTEMVGERRVGRLHQAVRTLLPEAEAGAVMADAGRRTADYLLAHRIPRPAQQLLRLLPAGLAARALVGAIRSNAWTFAGSGRFEARVDTLGGVHVVFTLVGNPLCAGERSDRPVCTWHTAVFRRLFEALVSPGVRVTETHCEGSGDPCCRFVARWSPR